MAASPLGGQFEADSPSNVEILSPVDPVESHDVAPLLPCPTASLGFPEFVDAALPTCPRLPEMSKAVRVRCSSSSFGPAFFRPVKIPPQHTPPPQPARQCGVTNLNGSLKQHFGGRKKATRGKHSHFAPQPRTRRPHQRGQASLEMKAENHVF